MTLISAVLVWFAAVSILFSFMWVTQEITWKSENIFCFKRNALEYFICSTVFIVKIGEKFLVSAVLLYCAGFFFSHVDFTIDATEEERI